MCSGKVAVDHGLETAACAGQGLEFGLVDGVGAVVVGAEGDVAVLFLRRKIGEIAGVELLQGGRVELIVADPVEQIDEAAVRLAVDVLQFDGDQFDPAAGQCC